MDGIKKAAAAVQAGAMAVLLEVPSGLCFLSVMRLFVLCVVWGFFFSGGFVFFFCIVFLVRSKVLEPFANIGQVFWSCDEYECMQTCCSPDFRVSGWGLGFRV